MLVIVLSLILKLVNSLLVNFWFSFSKIWFVLNFYYIFYFCGLIFNFVYFVTNLKLLNSDWFHIGEFGFEYMFDNCFFFLRISFSLLLLFLYCWYYLFEIIIFNNYIFYYLFINWYYWVNGCCSNNYLIYLCFFLVDGLVLVSKLVWSVFLYYFKLVFFFFFISFFCFVLFCYYCFCVSDFEYKFVVSNCGVRRFLDFLTAYIFPICRVMQSITVFCLKNCNFYFTSIFVKFLKKYYLNLVVKFFSIFINNKDFVNFVRVVSNLVKCTKRGLAYLVIFLVNFFIFIIRLFRVAIFRKKEELDSFKFFKVDWVCLVFKDNFLNDELFFHLECFFYILKFSVNSFFQFVVSSFFVVFQFINDKILFFIGLVLKIFFKLFFINDQQKCEVFLRRSGWLVVVFFDWLKDLKAAKFWNVVKEDVLNRYRDQIYRANFFSINLRNKFLVNWCNGTGEGSDYSYNRYLQEWLLMYGRLKSLEVSQSFVFPNRLEYLNIWDSVKRIDRQYQVGSYSISGVGIRSESFYRQVSVRDNRCWGIYLTDFRFLELYYSSVLSKDLYNLQWTDFYKFQVLRNFYKNFFWCSIIDRNIKSSKGSVFFDKYNNIYDSFGRQFSSKFVPFRFSYRMVRDVYNVVKFPVNISTVYFNRGDYVSIDPCLIVNTKVIAESKELYNPVTEFFWRCFVSNSDPVDYESFHVRFKKEWWYPFHEFFDGLIVGMVPMIPKPRRIDLKYSSTEGLPLFEKKRELINSFSVFYAINYMNQVFGGNLMQITTGSRTYFSSVIDVYGNPIRRLFYYFMLRFGYRFFDESDFGVLPGSGDDRGFKYLINKVITNILYWWFYDENFFKKIMACLFLVEDKQMFYDMYKRGRFRLGYIKKKDVVFGNFVLDIDHNYYYGWYRFNNKGTVNNKKIGKDEISNCDKQGFKFFIVKNYFKFDLSFVKFFFYYNYCYWKYLLKLILNFEFLEFLNLLLRRKQYNNDLFRIELILGQVELWKSKKFYSYCLRNNFVIRIKLMLKYMYLLIISIFSFFVSLFLFLFFYILLIIFLLVSISLIVEFFFFALILDLLYILVLGVFFLIKDE